MSMRGTRNFPRKASIGIIILSEVISSCTGRCNKSDQQMVMIVMKRTYANCHQLISHLQSTIAPSEQHFHSLL